MGITPQSIKKTIGDIMGSIYEGDHVRVDLGVSEDGLPRWIKSALGIASYLNVVGIPSGTEHAAQSATRVRLSPL